MQKKEKYLLCMDESEKRFLEEISWRQGLTMAGYLRMLLHEAMNKNPSLVPTIVEKKKT